MYSTIDIVLEENEGFGGRWDSFNVVDIDTSGEEAVFNLATTVMLEIVVNSPKHGEIDLTGFLKQTVEIELCRKLKKKS
jgi:hypothetical protein